MPTLLRRLAPVAFAMVIAASAAGTSPAPAAAADLTPAAAETELVRLLNVERAKKGLIALRVDPRLTTIARARSADMVAKNYFSHTQPDGRNVFDIINASGITWYGAGEIIAWNNWPTLYDSAIRARDGWMGSTGHRNIVLSSNYNYVGIGLAVDAATGKKLWTGVFLKGPDRTGGWTRFNAIEAAKSPASTSKYRYVTVSWSGGDTRLAVLTAGFQKYQLQWRMDDGAWTSLSWSMTTPYRTLRIWQPHTYSFRVRACDKLGNCGAWVYQTVEA